MPRPKQRLCIQVFVSHDEYDFLIQKAKFNGEGLQKTINQFGREAFNAKMASELDA